MTIHKVIKDGKEITIEMPDIPVKQKTKRSKPFALVELDLMERMAQAVGSPMAFVLVKLMHLAWQAKVSRFHLQMKH
jgi:hypothetical protein